MDMNSPEYTSKLSTSFLVYRLQRLQDSYLRAMEGQMLFTTPEEITGKMVVIRRELESRGVGDDGQELGGKTDE